MNEERRLFELILNGDNPQQLMEFISRLQLPQLTNLNYKLVSKVEAKCSIKCSSQETYREVYQNLDKILIEIL